MTRDDNFSASVEQKDFGDFDDQTLCSPGPGIQDELRTLIVKKNANNKEVINWIEVSELRIKCQCGCCESISLSFISVIKANWVYVSVVQSEHVIKEYVLLLLLM